MSDIKIISKRRRRRSIVRLLVSLLPDFLWKYLMPGPRYMYFNPGRNTIYHHTKSHLDDSNSSFTSFKSYLSAEKSPDLLRNSTPKVNSVQDAKIKALQKELQELRSQVAKIMEHHCEHLQSSDYGSLGNPSPENKRYSFPNTITPSPAPAIPPPPPPPPPPPLPPSVSNSVPQKIGKKSVKSQKPPHGFPFGDDLLKDLKKVKLKQVEKSPGGGPLKKNKIQKDPGDFLEEVLRKRFGVIQDSTPDTSPDSTINEISESFSADSYRQGIHRMCQNAQTAS